MAQKTSEWSCNLGKILYEAAIETRMTQEATDFLHIHWRRQAINHLNFGFINLNSSRGNQMTEDNTLLNQEMTLLPIEYQISFKTTL
jgi:hypothetical protein